MSVIDKVITCGGDLSKLSIDERAAYYKEVCASVGLNPLSEPFKYIVLNGKLTLYATKSCTEQLRKINGISLQISSAETIDGVHVVRARATDKDGRIDESIGAVSLIGSNDKGKYALTGDALANAYMKAETKAKRRVTLSISGLGYLDETEIETIPEVHFPEPENKKTETKTEAKTEAKTEKADTKAKADKKAETKPEEKADKAKSEGEVKSEVKSEAKPEVKSETAQYQVVIFEEVDNGQKVVFVEDMDPPEAVLIWDKKFPEGTALNVTGTLKDGILTAAGVTPVGEAESAAGTDNAEGDAGDKTTITLITEPKPVTVHDAEGQPVVKYWAYCDYKGHDDETFVVGDISTYAKGDIINVTIVAKEIGKNNKMKLVIEDVKAA